MLARQVTGTPQCIIKDPVGSGHHCVVTCLTDADCGPGPDSVCQGGFTPKICTYTSAGQPLPLPEPRYVGCAVSIDTPPTKLDLPIFYCATGIAATGLHCVANPAVPGPMAGQLQMTVEVGPLCRCRCIQCS